ncbi:MAG: hypothetical protein FWD68_04990 [Alphaproteobacteria bacterium]|nr:hypothetical protein [Alphaproteobacteria bacterium]
MQYPHTVATTPVSIDLTTDLTILAGSVDGQTSFDPAKMPDGAHTIARAGFQTSRCRTFRQITQSRFRLLKPIDARAKNQGRRRDIRSRHDNRHPTADTHVAARWGGRDESGAWISTDLRAGNRVPSPLMAATGDTEFLTLRRDGRHVRSFSVERLNMR